jgi:tetratricopeptide (TPR) repeat protein
MTPRPGHSGRETSSSTLWDLGPFELLLQRKLGTADTFQVRPVSRLIAASEEDATLADQLLRLPRSQRLTSVEREPVYRRESLARLFAMRCEASLHLGACDAPAAELAVAVAVALDIVPGGSVERAAALAFWLLGKTSLAARRWQEAENAFEMMHSFVPAGVSEERALALCGLAQLRSDQGAWDDAIMLFGWAALLFARMQALESAAACRAQQADLLVALGAPDKARDSLEQALQDLDCATAPSLAARLLLALGGCEAAGGRLEAARTALRQARGLYDLPAAPGEEVQRAWLEGRVAAAAGETGVADRLLDGVRRQLLTGGSLQEAARVTLDQVLLRLRDTSGDAGDSGDSGDSGDAGRAGDAAGPSAVLVAELAAAFPLATEHFAASLAELAAIPAAERARAAGELHQRLWQTAPEEQARPPHLTPLRALADRLLRRIDEHQDPLGAAGGL